MMQASLVWRSALLVMLASGLLACSSLSDDEDKDIVAPLVELPEGAIKLDDAWSRGLGDQGDEALSLAITPAIDGGTIYAANADGRVLAISRADGDVRWKTHLDAPIISAVGAGSGLVIVSSNAGVIHALDAVSGEQKWTAQASSEVLAAAVTDGDVVIVQAVNSQVQAFDAATGKLRWSYSASQAVLSLRGNSAPVIRDGFVYLAFDTGKIAALDAKSGVMRWEQRFVIPEGRSELERVIDVQGDPLVTDSDVVVGCYQGAVISVERERGQPQWGEKASVLRSMAEGDGSVFIVEGGDVLRAMRMSTGREAWKSDVFAGRHLSAPAVIGEYVAVADKEGYIHLLSQSDGRYAGRYKVGGDGVRNNLLSDGSTLYVLTNSGKLYALGIKASSSGWFSQ
jgi:outer membrane protein assembly factor BamB